ncbi:CDP-glucose 4,6-dehydratase [Undibacterium cyanobacteriorum]|uniref:CDP-glucose 4,6-dehydratase n=1 Tax=Undibacterium cyanobacteriorum TaxID=3073561 RepID=A0ABY9RM01_9BURK|nr:CDP-glucose 4,6-dehydratase [Undibacterium sp. 20NA77.5]WMW82229.1 CDP-glucose 4,6-dehydratase [Undibacterium sp. 20NA77.5]
MVTSQTKRRLPNPQFWRGRKVALTGHTGFKGAWLSLVLEMLGAKVSGVALAPMGERNLFDAARIDQRVNGQFSDIRDYPQLKNWLQSTEAEVVLHLAAQALVRESYADPIKTMTTNFNGTLNVLEALREVPGCRSVVVVTTDKVYRNLENAQAFVEDDPLGGHDPYSASKAACEILVESYAKSFLTDLGIASARAGNVIGGGDWAADRLIPDAVRAWHSNQPLSIRRPEAVRPWQHVLEPICAYLVLAEHLYSCTPTFSTFNFGPSSESHVSVRTVIDQASTFWQGSSVAYASELQGPHEAGVLHLDCGKAKRELELTPLWEISKSIEKTMCWYRDFYHGDDAFNLCMRDIESYLC